MNFLLAFPKSHRYSRPPSDEQCPLSYLTGVAGPRGIQGRPKEKLKCAFPRSVVSVYCLARCWRYPLSDSRQIPTSKALRVPKSRGRWMTCANESCSIESNNWKSVSPMLRGAHLPHNPPRAKRPPPAPRLLRTLPRQRRQLKRPRQRQRRPRQALRQHKSQPLPHRPLGPLVPLISAAAFLLTTRLTPTIRRA